MDDFEAFDMDEDIEDVRSVTENSPEDMERYIVRRLTPLECSRLQAFPDWWTEGVEGSQAAQYKLWGNGMTSSVIFYAMCGFREALDEEERSVLYDE